MNKELKQALELVFGFARQVQNKLYGEHLDGGKNKMAMAIIFEMKFRDFFETIKKFKDPFTKNETEQALSMLDELCKCYTSDDITWNMFWEGMQPINPEKIPFIIIDEKGNKKRKLINLNDVKTIKIPQLLNESID